MGSNNNKSSKAKLLAKKGFNNPNALIREAYADSDPRTPVILITKDKETSIARVRELHNKVHPSSNSARA